MKDLNNIYPKLNEQLISNEDLEIELRVFNQWIELGLIDFDKQVVDDIFNNKERRSQIYFNAYEALWLLIVKDLKGLNVEDKMIVQMKEYLFKDQVNDVELTPENIKELSENGLFETVVKSLPEEIRVEMSNLNMDLNDFVKTIQSLSKRTKEFRPNWLTTFYTTILLYNKTPVIQIIKKGITFDINIIVLEDFYPHNSKLDSMQEIVKNLMNDFYINIPIRKYFERIFTDFKLDVLVNKFELFSKLELELLESIQKGDFEEIKIYNNSEKDFLVTVIKKSEIKNEKINEIKKILGFNKYDKVDMIFRNDKHVIIKNEIRNKIEK